VCAVKLKMLSVGTAPNMNCFFDSMASEPSGISVSMNKFSTPCFPQFRVALDRRRFVVLARWDLRFAVDAYSRVEFVVQISPNAQMRIAKLR